MKNSEVDKLNDIFSRYGANLQIELKNELLYPESAGMTHYKFILDTRISMNVEFGGAPSFARFVHDLTLLDELRAEEYHRRRNPALQHAWEEYQIILKLSR